MRVLAADDAQAARLAEHLLTGGLVAWCRGGAEFGPRALCRRSFLGGAHDAATRDRLNDVKGRESWRPLAPVALADAVPALLAVPSLATPYMTVAGDVTSLASRTIPAGVHVDGSTRLQAVARSTDPLLTSVLTVVGAATGVPAAVNTSLNVGTPIVTHVDDAIDLMLATGVGAGVFDDVVVWKD